MQLPARQTSPLPLASFISSIESGCSNQPLGLSPHGSEPFASYSAAGATAHCTMRRECLSPLTKNPQKGKGAGWRAHHSTVCPSIFREGEGWDDSPCPLENRCLQWRGRQVSWDHQLTLTTAPPKPILPSSFHVFRTVLGQIAG